MIAVPDAALEAFAAALGADAVLTAPEELREFRDPFAFATWDDYVASAVLMPTTVEQIQEIVRIANEHRVPLWTHSQGRNNGYGGPAPRVAGSVIVSLRNMNRVLEIDEELGYAVVEPGVRWFDLYEAITAGDHRLMLSIADLGWGSVVGNSLDHGITYMPTGMDFMAPCGLEVVLPSGEVMRTGMGAMPGNPSWHVYRRGIGPNHQELFMQSNFGIVTKMGVWLNPMPEVYMPLWLRLWRDEDLPAAMDVLRRLMMDGTIRMVPQMMNTMLLAGVFSKRDQWWTEPGPIPDHVIDHMARELEVGRWMMRFAIYEDEAIADAKFAKIRAAFETIEGAEVWGTKHRPEDIPSLENPAERIQGGVPNLEWNNMTGWYGGEQGGHIGFSPVAPTTAAHTRELCGFLRAGIEGAGLDYIAGLLAISARSFVHITMVIFDVANEAQARAAYDVSKRLVVEAAEKGYGEYRAHLDFMDLAVEQYSFNNHVQRRFNETIKDALDPNGILSPGKQGIWPRAMREERA